MPNSFDLRSRGRAAGIHLLISAAVALAAAVLVFGLWYPGEYRHFAGGQGLFLLLTGVDVVLGPLLTFAVFDMKKGWPHLRRDLVVIALVQLAALVYGLHTVYAVRPVAMVFERDRFRVLQATQVLMKELPQALPEYRELPLTGPRLLGTRAPKAGDESNDALFKGLEGIDVGQRPIFWQPYAKSAADAVAKSRPLVGLLAHYPARKAELQDAIKGMHVDEATARFLPLMARGDWVAVIDASGTVVGYLPVDGFF